MLVLGRVEGAPVVEEPVEVVELFVLVEVVDDVTVVLFEVRVEPVGVEEGNETETLEEVL